MDAADMEQLIKSENKLISQFENYITEQENKLETLKLKVLELKNENDRAKTIYFLNPIDKFSVNRRLTIDWEEIEQHIFNDKFLGVMQSLKNVSNFPNRKDFENSISALFFLQDIYNISTPDLVKGVINGINYNTSLSSKDCFELGFEAYKNQDYYHSIHWLNATLNKLIIDKFNCETQKIVLAALAESYFQIGDVDNAVRISSEILKLSKDNLPERIKEFYKSKTSEISQNKNMLNEFPLHIYEYILYSGLNYPNLCRDTQNQYAKKSYYLNCYYENNKIPFLLIAPFKKEILSIDPLLAIFHDVISDNEIKSCLKAVDILEPSATYFDKPNNRNLTRFRISKHKWFSNYPKAIRDIEKRAGDITALDMRRAESFNIKNYEIGGYYSPHHDFFPETGYAYGDKLHNLGNRISTLIFYMNDVEQGGATVFPVINITVLPKKGSALFWYNLHSSGYEDRRTLHGACPVLVGSKWISTFWIREALQDIHRPCVETSRIKN